MLKYLKNLGDSIDLLYNNLLPFNKIWFWSLTIGVMIYCIFDVIDMIK